MTIEQFLNSDIESAVTNLHSAFEGLLLSGEYKGRRVLITKTDIGYIVTITDPDLQFFSAEAMQAVKVIRSKLDDGQGSKSKPNKPEENTEKLKEDLIGG